MLASVVADHMTETPHAVGRRLLVPTARELMRGARVDHLPVIDGRRLVGMVSERELGAMDLLEEVGEMTVEDVMAPAPYVVAARAPLASVAAEMAELGVGAAVVMRAHRVVGVFTEADAIRALAQLLSA